MRPIWLLLCGVMLASGAQEPQFPNPEPKSESDDRLPNGKSQKDAIAKEEYEKSVQDARELVKLAENLQADLEKNDRFVVSVPDIRKTEDIEKLGEADQGAVEAVLKVRAKWIATVGSSKAVNDNSERGCTR